MKNLPLAHPKPDANLFINQLMGRAEGQPRLVEYLVDDMVMRPIVTGLIGRPWVVETTERETQKAALDNFIEFWYRMGYDFVRFERSMGFTTRTLLLADTAPQSKIAPGRMSTRG